MAHRAEALALYRDILRTARAFYWCAPSVASIRERRF